MAENEKAVAAIERAEKLGMRISYESGLLVVTAKPEPRDVEMEQAVIEQLGKNLPEVYTVAAGRARGARGKEFLGRQVFIPAERIVGTLTDCNPDGIVTVAHRLNSEREHGSGSAYSGAGENMLIIDAGDEQPIASSSVLSPWIASDKLREKLERAESLGLRLEYDAGFILAKWPAAVDAEIDVIEATIRELGRSLGELRNHLVARARGIGGGDFVGSQVFLPEFDAVGILESCSTDGLLEVRYDRTDIGQVTCHFPGDALFVIVGEVAQAVPAEQKSEARWRGLLRRAFGA